MSDTDLYDDVYDERPAPRRRISYDPTQARGEAAFRAAARHSRVVRWLKYILPVLAIVAAGVFWAATQFSAIQLPDAISVAGIDIDSKSVVIDKPHISGFEGTRRAYEVKAESAVQSLDNPKVVTFNGIDARIGLDDAGTATLGATTGVYDGDANTLMLSDGIDIKTTTGYWATFEDAAVDLGKGNLSSSRPIEIHTDQGSIRANSIEVIDRGKRIAFRNGVSVTYLPPGDLAAAPPAQAAGE